ncbi:MAG: aspartate aminotransferase family protein [Alphaproteobacteria bacterium TMED62]|nr:MAG: aspartate aminotransferase family protein [Alphaproteobacteria bacterium TMED62]|tara:strand:+ start:6976 stop:8262 length:1287 start_codon:yes stop_codon:yes gene_type:complete
MKKSFKISNRLYGRASKTIPLATQTFSKSSMQWPLGAAPMFFEKAKGCYVYDVDGNKYIDYLLALLPIILGYKDNDVDRAVKKQINKGVIFSMSHPIEIELAEKLNTIIPYAEMVRFGKNGSDVLSAAIRLARAYTKKDLVLVSGYHGWHDWFIGSTSRNAGVPKEVRRLTKNFKFNDIENLTYNIKKYNNKIAAVVIEPDGYSPPNKNFLKELKKICRKNGILIIFDEIVCGFRTSLGGASEKFNIKPDLGCFGKSLGNGYPISAIVGKKKIMNLMKDVFVSGTYAGETLSMAAALATLNKIEKLNVPEKLSVLGKKLKKLTNRKIRDIELNDYIEFAGNDWWPRLIIKKNNQSFLLHLLRQEFIKNGVFMGSSFNLCLAHSNNDILKNSVSKIEKSLLNVKDILKKKDPQNFLEGCELKSIFSVRG